jgi:hypothetical protein
MMSIIVGEWTILNFDERCFAFDDDHCYRNASWFATGSGCDFGLLKWPDMQGEIVHSKQSATLE